MFLILPDMLLLIRSRLKRIEHYVTEAGGKNKSSEKIFPGTFASVSDVIIAMVNLRELSAKQFWEGLERLDENLEKLRVEPQTPKYFFNKAGNLAIFYL